MNFKGTKKLYIIKTCEQILYFNSIKHHIQFQYNCRGWGTTPQKSVQIHPAVCFLPCQILTKLQCMWFSLSYFRPHRKFYPQFQTLQGLYSSLKTWCEQLPRKMLLGCVLLKVYFLTGVSLNAYSLFTVYISLYIPLFQIRKYSYIAYDNLV